MQVKCISCELVATCVYKEIAVYVRCKEYVLKESQYRSILNSTIDLKDQDIDDFISSFDKKKD